MDEYIDRIQGQGASLGLILDKSVSATPSGLASTVGNGEEFKAVELNELKQMHKQIKKLVVLKKQDNMMAAFFLSLCNCSWDCLCADH